MGQARADHGDLPGVSGSSVTPVGEPSQFSPVDRPRKRHAEEPCATTAGVFQRGSKLIHPFNPELGVGVVREVEGRFLLVYFPTAKRTVTLSSEAGGLDRLVLEPGSSALLQSTGETVEIAALRDHAYVLSDGREVSEAEVWPTMAMDTPIERLAGLRLDSLDSFRNRIQGLELMQLRESGGLGSFLGGRIELFPHQLDTALRAVESERVRWLLADEVGLGKTVEACLVLSALVRTGRAERALVVAPSTLAIQWLGELYRKFHQVFVLLDDERIEAVATDFGEDVNPFDVHPFAVVPLELISADSNLLRCAAEAGLDLIVVDEAHRLVSEEWIDSLGPLVRDARHALLLTATPLQSDRRGFHSLLSLLHPEAFGSFEAFDALVDAGKAAIACTSAVRRADVGGLPPRVAVAVDIEGPSDEITSDSRTRWLVENTRKWLKRGEKALVFVRDLETLEALGAVLESETRTRVTVFHEELSAAKRDIEIAAFRESSVALLLCTEAGGEGRNFQFCDRMVHFDLPFDPVELEQRIGRLDRIGRKSPVEIVYFRCDDASAPNRARLAPIFETLDLFTRPAAGLDPALETARKLLAQAALEESPLDADAVLAAVETARQQDGTDAVRVFYPDAYVASRAAAVLERVPADLEERTQTFCIGASEDLGFDCIDKGGDAMFYIEFGSGATVDALPGVPGGTRYLGTFDRAEAVEKEEYEFFASGHPLVEGLLLELEDGVRGRACLMELPKGILDGAGLLLVFKDGPDWRAEVVDAEGKNRPDWAKLLLSRLDDAIPVRMKDWSIGDGWAEGMRGLAARATEGGKLVSVAFFRSR